MKRLFGKFIFDKGDGKYVVVYWWWNHNLCVRYVYLLKAGLNMELTEKWKSYCADEPSEFYLKTTKIGGILFALFGIIMIMLPVILE